MNKCCEGVGRLGSRIIRDPNTSKWRRRLMQASVVTNFCAAALTMTACFAISTNFEILQHLPFSTGRISLTNLRREDESLIGEVVTTTANIGLQAVAYSDVFFASNRQVYIFDDFCDYNGTGLERFILPQDCNTCSDVSASLIFSLAVSVFPFIPSMITSVIRMYSNYDINCLKFFGVFVTGISMAMSMYTYLAYRHQCFFAFFEGDLYFTENLTHVANESEATFKATVAWFPGNALICILFATGLMCVDILLHLLLPSPSMARNHDEQEAYELVSMHDGVTQNVSFREFVLAFVDMIVGRQSNNDEEQPAPVEKQENSNDPDALH